MYEFAFDRFAAANRTPQEIDAFVNAVRLKQRQSGSRAADQLFIDTVGCQPLPVFDEEYYSIVVDYNLALLLAHCGSQEEAARLMEGTGVLPGTGGALLFTDQNRLALAEHELQSSAATQGTHSVLIASLPKSGSASLSHNLAAILDARVLRLSIGDFPSAALVPRWVNSFSRGGALTHDHFEPSPHNLGVLANCGFKKVFVQVRDPRAAFWSMLRWEERLRAFSHAGKPLKDLIEDRFQPMNRWIADWAEIARRPDGPEVEWIQFREYKTDPWAVLERLAAGHIASAGRRDDVLARLRCRENNLSQLNFERGDDQAWRIHASPEDVELLWRHIPPVVAETLELQP